jgi:hypothetical protein
MPAPESQKNRPHRPKALMVFATAFIAGAVAAVGINRALDVHLAQSRPKVESEPIFVALRSLPQGTPVTIWDVALRDWPKAMMPSTALRAHDHFEGMVLRHPLREGQPLLSVQLAKAAAVSEITPAPMVAPSAQPIPLISQGVASAQPQAPAASPVTLPPAAVAEADLWAATPEPVVPAPVVATAPAPTPAVTTEPVAIAGEPTIAEPPVDAEQPVATEPVEAVSVVTGPPAAAPIVDPQAAAGTSTPAPAQPFVRYLVVPERIAMQADNSFVSPAASAVVAAAAAPAKPAPVKKPAAATTNVPPVAQHPGSRRPQPATNAQRPPQTKQTPNTKSVPQAPSRTGRPQGNAAETSRPQGMFGTMFPSLRAGIEAVESEMRRDRQEPATGVQPSSPPRKNKPHPPSQSAAGWPNMGGSPRSF